MISLTFLPLNNLADTHYLKMKTKALDRFKEIETYVLELQSLQAKPVFPEAEIKVATAGFRKSTADAIAPAKTPFPNFDLYKDCLDILGKLKTNFDTTLKGTPRQIDSLVNELKPFLTKYHGNGKKFSFQLPFRHFIECLKYIWDYGDFIDIQTNPLKYDAYTLAKDLSVSTCPYCNRAFTFTVIIDDTSGKKTKQNKIIRPQFDHFYSKSRYPFLGIAFYNLVPSCSICNSTLKGETEMSIDTHCHPYVEGYEDVYFFETGVSVKDYLAKGKPPLAIKFNPRGTANSKLKGRAKATHEVFEISTIYPYHADIAEEMFLRSTEDSEKVIDSYWNQISAGGKYMFSHKHEVYRHFIGNFYMTSDFYKRPLSKFQHDILKETKLVDYIKNLPDRPDPSKVVPLNKV
jgi:hypothetical protein